MSEASAREWHMIRTAPNKEFYVNDLLAVFDLDVYTPFERVPRAVNKYTKAKRERRRYVSRPVLRGYVFVAIPTDATIAYHRLLVKLYHLKLIRGLVGMGPSARRLFTDEINVMREIYGPGYCAAMDKNRQTVTVPEGLMQTGKEFKVGDCVALHDGPLSDITMIVTGIEDAQAKMLMTIFGHERTVKAPVSDLVKRSNLA